MYLSLTLRFFVMMFVVVRCRNISFTNCEKTTKSNTSEMSYTNFTCLEHRKELGRTVLDSKCRPMYVHIPLKSTMPLYNFYPSVAYVKRCSGHCGASLSCLPTSVKMIKVPVILKPRELHAEEICVFVNVVEHTGCKCM